MRVAFGKRMRPRTSTNAAIVPMIVARIETMTATVIELPTARSSTRLLSIASYQWSVKPGDRQARRRRLVEREDDHEQDRQVEEHDQCRRTRAAVPSATARA